MDYNYEAGVIKSVTAKPTKTGKTKLTIVIDDQVYQAWDVTFIGKEGIAGEWKYKPGEYNGLPQRTLQDWKFQDRISPSEKVDIGVTAQGMAQANRFQGNMSGNTTHTYNPKTIAFDTQVNKPSANYATKQDLVDAVSELKKYIDQAMPKKAETNFEFPDED